MIQSPRAALGGLGQAVGCGVGVWALPELATACRCPCHWGWGPSGQEAAVPSLPPPCWSQARAVTVRPCSSPGFEFSLGRARLCGLPEPVSSSEAPVGAAGCCSPPGAPPPAHRPRGAVRSVERSSETRRRGPCWPPVRGAWVTGLPCLGADLAPRATPGGSGQSLLEGRASSKAWGPSESGAPPRRGSDLGLLPWGAGPVGTELSCLGSGGPPWVSQEPRRPGRVCEVPPAGGALRGVWLGPPPASSPDVVCPSILGRARTLSDGREQPVGVRRDFPLCPAI